MTTPRPALRMAALAATALGAAGCVIGSRTPPDSAPTTLAPASATAPASAGVQPVIPPVSLARCGAGTWTLATVVRTSPGTARTAAVTGGRGAVLTIRADGRASLDFTGSEPATGRIAGRTYRVTYRGTATGRLTLTGARVSAVEQHPATATAAVNGRTVTSPVPLLGGSAAWNCAPHGLQITSPALTVRYVR